MQVAICDDNKLFLQELENQLLTLPEVEKISVFSDLGEFLRSVKEGSSFDAVLMDIDWNEDRTGMDAAAELYQLNPETKIIYVTGCSDRYSQRIFLQRSNLSGFLTKPVDIELLKANLQKVADDAPVAEQPSIALRQDGGVVAVPLREIYFMESRGHTIETHTAGGTVISYGRLDKIINSLPGFYQCHKSYIVNMRQIQRFQSNEIQLKNGEIIPVSRSKYNETKKAYFNFIGATF